MQRQSIDNAKRNTADKTAFVFGTKKNVCAFAKQKPKHCRKQQPVYRSQKSTLPGIQNHIHNNFPFSKISHYG